MTMPKGGQSYNQIVAPPGMVGFWPGTTVPVSGSVNDLSGNGNNLIYATSSMSDSIRDSKAGYWSSASAVANSTEAFYVPVNAFNPNVNGNNDSLFVSTVINLPAQLATQAIMGNTNSVSTPGVSLWNTGNAIAVYIKASAVTQLGISAAIAINTDYRVTLYIDGPTKKAFAWLNGTMFINNVDVSALGSFYTAGSYFGFGVDGEPGPNVAPSQAVSFKDATVFWLKANAYLKSPAYLDWLLRTKPSYQLTLLDTLR